MAFESPVKGLVYLWTKTSDSAQLQSLSANDTGGWNATFQTHAKGLLVKRYRTWGSITLMPVDYKLWVFLSGPGGTAPGAEIALEEEVNDPEEVDHWDEYARQAEIIVNSLFPIMPIGMEGQRADNDTVFYDSGWMTVGAKGKGIPYQEGKGPKLFCYNNSAALPADVIHDGFTIYEVVHLND